MKNKMILSLTVLTVLLIGCDYALKTENMLAAERSFPAAKTAGASDRAPVEYYQAEKQFTAYESAWRDAKYIDADYAAAICSYLSEAAIVRADTKQLQDAAKKFELDTLKVEKEIGITDSYIKDLKLKAKDLTIDDRNRLLAARDQKLTELGGRYRLLYASKLKDEEAALKNVDALSAQIDELQKQLAASQGDLSTLSSEDQKRRALAIAQVASLSKRLNDERVLAERLQQENESLAMKADAEQLKNKAVQAVANATVIKVKAETMGAREGASAQFASGEKTLAQAKQKLAGGVYIEARVLAITAGTLYNDAITAANSRYLEETERLRKAREEIKAVFRGLEDTEITDTKGQVKIIMRGALFAFNKAVLMGRFHERLDRLAEILVRYNEFPISVEGHTDNIGKDTYNLNLSSERAGALTTYLIDAGHIEGRRIVALGYGKSRPVSNNDSEVGRSKNRRVEIILQRNFSPGDKR